MIAARAMFASPAASRALVDGRIGAVETMTRGGTYVSLGDDWLLLVGPSEPSGPLTLTVQGMATTDMAPVSPVEVSDGRLIIGGQAVSLERMRVRRQPSRAPTSVWSADAVARAAAVAMAELPAVATSAPVAPRLRRGVDALATGSLVKAVEELAGLGEGLTPAGDDLLAGYAAWRVTEGDPAANDGVGSADALRLSVLATGRSSPLGLAYLRCAERGELPDAGARLVDAIRHGSVAAVQAAIPGLRAWGTSSGVALGWGIVAAAAGESAVWGLCDRIVLRQGSIPAQQRLQNIDGHRAGEQIPLAVHRVHPA